MSPSSAGMPVMSLPYEPVMRHPQPQPQPHCLTVNDDEWSVGGDVSGLRGTVIRGDGYLPGAPPGTFADSPLSQDAFRRSGSRSWRRETEVEEDDVIVERF
ncbi:hypothetical protein ANCCAN_16543 [Ancylostoma caninum]|uniref:Uncharacterized protein n=1 Tax=Ancylostoma caninum TaxID=29170 RepID=A0A368G2N3_ANCCA|nr:hypothetical protein ANCCAN_16543 [Ancylostoma caninum]